MTEGAPTPEAALGGLPPVEEQRAAVAGLSFEAPRRYRVLFLGRYANGPTDIVAALHRALENLGHTVFHLDLSRHGQVLDNPTDARGGYGPIFVRVDRLRAVLDRFRPQLLVLCAMGMVLDDEAAAELRARGVLSLGVTLSDPDVQPSIVDHVGTLDYHTTNAELSLKRYHERGLRNTLLMPFGIDKDFVAQRVPPAPGLRTTVTCIGHAVGRADRHAVMERLASEFDVRVYGNGWPLAGAETVAGPRLLQAAREATFHVNFPATRAGFTNVKCGVFETVGAGAVLCTAEFDEMRRFFDYDEEIVGYAGGEDLARTLGELVRDPDRVERMRRRAFRRLVSEHLYEHRWLDLFARIEADLEAGDGSVVGAERAAELRTVLATDHGRPRVVLLSGYYGARNLGDDLLLESISRSIESGHPDAHVVVAASNPAPVEIEQGLPAFARVRHQDAEEWAARAGAVVLGGGGLWHDYSIRRAGGVAGLVSGATLSPAHLTQLPLMTRIHGGDFHVFGMGAGPLDDEDARALVRYAASIADSVVVRDAASKAVLEALPGWPCEVEQAPDAVYALELGGGAVPDRVRAAVPGPYLALNLRPWSGAGAHPERHCGAVLAAAERAGLGVVGVPMQPADESLLHELLGEARAPGGVAVLSAAKRPGEGAGALLAVLAGARAVVAMRLHTALLAHRLGRPVVGLAYDPKVRLHFAEIGRGDRAVPLEVAGEELTRAVLAATAEAALPPDVRERVSRLERDAVVAGRRLGERVAGAPLRLPPSGRIREAPQRTVVVPEGWDAADLLDLKPARVVSGSTEDPARPVPARSSVSPRGVLVHLTESAPRRGDFVSWHLAVPTDPDEGRRVELLLEQRYPERPGRRGRMAYELRVDGEVLFREDVTAWKQRNTVWVAWNRPADSVDVEVRVVALRDCEDSQWGRAGAVWIIAARSLPWAGHARLRWGASSPFAKPPSTPSVTSRAPSLRRRAAAAAVRVSRTGRRRISR